VKKFAFTECVQIKNKSQNKPILVALVRDGGLIKKKKLQTSNETGTEIQKLMICFTILSDIYKNSQVDKFLLIKVLIQIEFKN
jgi:hypothetical protein